MNIRRTTRTIVIGFVLILIAWDVIPYLSRESGDTISEFIGNSASRHPSIAWFSGVLVGHFFWPGLSIPLSRTIKMLWVPSAILFSIDFIGILPSGPGLPLPTLLIGICAGHLFWPLPPGRGRK